MSPAARALVGAIDLYRRFVSPMFARRCRFEPTCAAYATEAVRLHGAVRGGWLTLKRLVRCHPWNPGGVDHVPARGGS